MAFAEVANGRNVPTLLGRPPQRLEWFEGMKEKEITSSSKARFPGYICLRKKDKLLFLSHLQDCQVHEASCVVLCSERERSGKDYFDS